GNDRVARALAYESAASRALLEAEQAGIFQRAQRFAECVARHAELHREGTLGWQPIAGAQAAIRDLFANLIGNFLERARRPDASEFDAAGRARLVAMGRPDACGVSALDIRICHMLHWFNHCHTELTLVKCQARLAIRRKPSGPENHEGNLRR